MYRETLTSRRPVPEGVRDRVGQRVAAPLPEPPDQGLGREARLEGPVDRLARQAIESRIAAELPALGDAVDEGQGRGRHALQIEHDIEVRLHHPPGRRLDRLGLASMKAEDDPAHLRQPEDLRSLALFARSQLDEAQVMEGAGDGARYP